MVAIDDYGDLVDEANPPPFWEWIFWLIFLVIILDGCMRRGV